MMYRIGRNYQLATRATGLPVMLTIILATSACVAYTPAVPQRAVQQYTKQQVYHRQRQSCLYAAVGIFFGTSTGNTQDCADKIYEALLSKEIDVAEPTDIDSVDSGSLADMFGQHDSLIVGTPTWNTNADTFRSGTGWDDLYYDKLPELASILTDKKVAVFGLGDQISYGENYADATGELYSVFESLGCDMVPYAHTSQDGYDHVTSKSILPDSDLFCGLLLDQINQDDMTDARVEEWIEKLSSGGFFESSGTTTTNGSSVKAATTVEIKSYDDEEEEDEEIIMVDSTIQKEVIAAVHKDHPIAVNDFTPHYNPTTGRTMWTSPDGRSSYVTFEPKNALSP